MDVGIYNGFWYASSRKEKKMIEVQIIVKNVALCFFSHKFTAQTYKQTKLCKMKDSSWAGCSDGFQFFRALPLDLNGYIYRMHPTHPSSKD